MNNSRLDGNKLRAMRQFRHISAPALARSLQVDRTTVYRWEWGESSPGRSTLVHIAQVLRCKVSDLEVSGDA